MALRTHRGHCELLVIPFGLISTLVVFQSTMNMVFQPYLHRFMVVFFDDILIYIKSFKEHIKHLEIVLDLLPNNRFYSKESKFDFVVE